MRPFSSCVGLSSISIIYAQPFTQLLHVSARKQLCKRLYVCTHKLYSVASVGATRVIYVYVSITRHIFKVRSGLKLPPIGCTVRERACAGSYMCSLANICHFIAGRSLFYVKED